jgi:DNA polymerase III sliding clamp (beta) subunit (PCNA family)
MNNNWYEDIGGESTLSNVVDGVDESDISVADGMIVCDTSELKSALSTVRKVSQTSSDAPMLSAVLIEPVDEMRIRLSASDMVSTSSAEVSLDEGSNLVDVPVAADAASLASIVALQGKVTKIAFLDGGAEIAVVFAGGGVRIPCFTLEAKNFRHPKLGDDADSRQVPAPVLSDTIAALKRLASKADMTEHKMLFGRDDAVYAIDGVSVIKSECFFPDAALTLGDATAVQALLSFSDQMTQVKVQASKNGVAFSTESGKVTCPFRSAEIPDAMAEMVAHPEDHFVVAPAPFARAVSALMNMRDATPDITLETNDGSVALRAVALDGRPSRIVLSKEYVGDDPEDAEATLPADALARVLSTFSGESFLKLAIDGKMIRMSSSSVVGVTRLGR